MSELTCGPVRARVDAIRGFEITSLTVDGAQILARADWPRAPAVPVATQEEWVAAWSGGWQLAFPSAGAAALSAPCPQGYHGAASQTPWALLAESPDRVRAEWRDAADLVAEREIGLTQDGVLVRTTVTNHSRTPRPVMITEHLALGGDILAADATIDAPGAEGCPLGADGAPAGPFEPWPGSADPPWSIARAGVTPARDMALRNIGESGVAVTGNGISARITWDTAALPHMWLWQEIAAITAPPWNGVTRALGIEPATTAHALGVDAAAARGDCPVIGPDASLSWWVRLAVSAR
jgi:hypothetical protein